MIIRIDTPRAGLANMLFPWARGHVYSRLHGIPMERPRWTRVRIGPVLRGERDRRHYLGQFSGVGQVGQWKALLLRATGGNLVSEPPALTRTPSEAGIGRRDVVVFSGAKGHFEPVLPYRRFVAEGLRSMANPALVEASEAISPPEIAIHLRHGDFRRAEGPSDFIFKGGIRTPVEWFVGVLRQVRREAGRVVPAAIVTDGDDADVTALLREPDTRLVRTGTALGDLLFLSRARVILGSGGSSFTAWGAFLSRAATVVMEGQSLSWFGLSELSGFAAYVSGLVAPDAEVARRCAEELEARSPAGVS